MDPFNAWDIAIMVNQTGINATLLSTAANTLLVNYSFATLYELENCVNGTGKGCYFDGPGSDGPGIVHSIYAAKPPVIGQLPQGPYTGLLFTITYKVVGSIPYSPIQFLFSSSYPVITGQSPDVFTSQDGIYGARLGVDFAMTINPRALTILQGSNSTSTMTVSSMGGFSGTVNLTLTSSTNGLSPSLNSTKLTLTSDHPTLVKLTVASNASSSAIQYTITVTGTSGSLSHQVPVTILVKGRPDFILNASPSVLKIHPTNSGSSIIALDTQSDFSGSIHLSLDVPSVPGLIASLGATDFAISPGQPATTVFAVRTPESGFPFVYQINITATSKTISHAETIIVKPPAPDFSLLLGGTGFVVQPGQSRSFTLTMTSIDYFKGQLFLLSASLSGAKEVFSRPALALDFGNSSTSTMTITTDANLAPGNHNVTLTALGTTFLGVSVNHTITTTITVIPVPVGKIILGLQPLSYFAIVGALWIGVIGAAIREIRKPKPKRFLS